jgi:hypothetical protein
VPSSVSQQNESIVGYFDYNLSIDGHNMQPQGQTSHHDNGRFVRNLPIEIRAHTWQPSPARLFKSYGVKMKPVSQDRNYNQRGIMSPFN